MYITGINIHNFRCYEDLLFSFGTFKPEDKQNIFIFSGQTGSGKTSLLNAIGWCLTGVESQELLDEIKHKMPIVGSYCDISKPREAYVELKIQFAIGKNIESATIKRSEYYLAQTMGPSQNLVKLTLHMSDGRSESYTNDDPEGKKFIDKYLAKLYPPQLSKFYIFDSEFMAKAYSGNLENVSSSLEYMFKIGAIKTMKYRLGEIYDEFEKETDKIAKGNNKIERLKASIQDCEDKLGELGKKIELARANREESKKELGDANKEIGALDNELRGIPDLTEVEDERKSLEKEMSKKIEEIDMLQASIAKHAIKDFPYLMSRERLQIALGNINKSEEQEMLHIPARVEYSLIVEIIERGKCICGRPVEVGSDERGNLEKLKKAAEKDGDKAVLRELAIHLNYWLREPEKIIKDYKLDSERLNSLKENLEEIKRNLGELMDKEQRAGKYKELYEQLNQLRSKKEFYDEQFNKYNDDYNKYIRSNDSYLQDLSKYKSELEAETGKIQGGEELKNQMKMVRALQGVFSLIPELLYQKFASNIADNINSMICNIPAMQKKIAEIVTMQNGGLSLEFKDPANKDLPTYLSGGQSRIAGISIISAFIKIFSSISDYAEVPFISIDNPFSGMDDETLEIFYNKLGEFLHGSQAIIFVPDTLFGHFMEKGKDSIRKAYYLENKSGMTELKEVYTN